MFETFLSHRSAAACWVSFFYIAERTLCRNRNTYCTYRKAFFASSAFVVNLSLWNGEGDSPLVHSPFRKIERFLRRTCVFPPLFRLPLFLFRGFTQKKRRKSPLQLGVKCHFPKKRSSNKKGEERNETELKNKSKGFSFPSFLPAVFFSRGGITECGKAMCVGKYRSLGVAFQKRQAGVGRDRQTSIVLFVRLLKKEERIFPSAE